MRHTGHAPVLTRSTFPSQIFSFFAAAAIGVVLFASHSANATIINSVVADDRGIQGSATGGPTGLGAQNDSFLRTFGVSTFWRSAIEFDLSGLTMGTIVSSATLSLRDEGTSTDGIINVFGYAADGTVTQSDALNIFNQVSSLTITSANGTEDFMLDVTAFIQSLAASGAGYGGFLLVSSNESNSSSGSDICSSEAGNGTGNFALVNCIGFGPALTIQIDEAVAVSAPASLILLLTGLGLLGFTRRKKT